MSLDTFLLVLCAVLGLVLGSAISALSWRMARRESWVRGRSRCTDCGHELGALDLVPVLSWLAHRGRCRHCGARVSVRYPLTELACAAWLMLVLRHDGLTLRAGLVALWGLMLVTLTFIDFMIQELPDALTLPGTLIALTAALLGPGARHALLGVALGAGLLWLIAETYLRVRKVEGMGFGDVKLAAMFGALLGPGATLLTLFLAALAGSVWGVSLMARGRGTGQTALPFGTLLAPAAMVAYLWGDHWIARYLSLVFPG